MGNKSSDKVDSAAKAPTPTPVRKGVKRMKMTPRKGGSVIKGKGNAETN